MPKEAHETVSRATRWHQSGLEQILGCPRQWFLEHVVQVETPVKLSTVAGTSYHAAVEFHELSRMQGVDVSREEMHEVAENTLAGELADADPTALAAVSVKPTKARAKAANLPEVLTGTDALVYQTHSCVDSFWLPGENGLSVREQLLPLVPLGVEVYGTAAMVDEARDLGGTVDGVYWDPNARKVVVIDHKTAGRLSDWKRPGKGVEQATHYALLAYADETLAALSDHLPTRTYLPEVRFMIAARIEPARATTSRSLTISIQPAEQELMNIGARVRRAEQLLEEAVFPANPAYTWCFTCPFRDRCIAGTRELMAPARLLVAS